jgi:ABC-type nitrate/sulfonate/bicarbonate transport system substrate-binding protein
MFADGERAGAADLGTIKVVVGAKSIEFIAADLGHKLGSWKKRGLDVQNVYVSGGGQVSQTLAAGAADIGLTGGPNAANAILKGLESRIVAAAAYSFVGGLLVVRKDSPAKTVADLKGKIFGISSPGSLTDFMATQVAAFQKWKLGTDYKKATVGGLDQLTAALQGGAIDAFAWSAEPAFLLQEKGQGRVLTNMAEFVGPNLFEVIQATSQAIKQKHDAVKAYLDGYFETVRYMASHPRETQAFMAENMGYSDYVVKATYDLEISNLSTNGMATAEQLEGVAKTIAKDGNVPPASAFWDPQFLPAGG